MDKNLNEAKEFVDTSVKVVDTGFKGVKTVFNWVGNSLLLGFGTTLAYQMNAGVLGKKFDNYSIAKASMGVVSGLICKAISKLV